MQLARFGDRVKAMQVLPRSPAQRAGLRQGATVVTIEKRPAAAWTPNELTELKQPIPTGVNTMIDGTIRASSHRARNATKCQCHIVHTSPKPKAKISAPSRAVKTD